MTDEVLTPNLNPDDSDAEADLTRLRAPQFRQTRRAQISTALPALLMIGLGALYLVNPPALTPPLALGLGTGALGLSLAARFLLNTRRERGLFFIGLLLLGCVGIGAVLVVRNLSLAQYWPLFVSLIGLAALITFLFERNHERGLVLPGLLLILAGGVALLFTLQIVPSAILGAVAVYWPLILILVALVLLPRAFSEGSN